MKKTRCLSNDFDLWCSLGAASSWRTWGPYPPKKTNGSSLTQNDGRWLRKWWHYSYPVFFGNDSAKDPRHQEIYDIVQESARYSYCSSETWQQRSDKIARDIITEAGYGDTSSPPWIWEWTRRFISSNFDYGEGNDMGTSWRMCFSVEPGVYFRGLAYVSNCLAVTRRHQNSSHVRLQSKSLEFPTII